MMRGADRPLKGKGQVLLFKECLKNDGLADNHRPPEEGLSKNRSPPNMTLKHGSQASLSQD